MFRYILLACVSMVLSPIAMAQTVAPVSAPTFPKASFEGTATGTEPISALQNNVMTVAPTGPSKADYRAGNFEVHLRTGQPIEKTDALSGYVRHYGPGIVRDHVYGGTLQYFNHGDGGAEWGTGAMVAAHNLGNGHITNAAGLSAVVRNERKAAIGIETGEGVFASIQNAGSMKTGNGVTGAIRNQGDLAAGVALRASINNKGSLPSAYGIKVETANTGALGEYHGLHIEAIDGKSAQTAWAIYSLLPNPSRLAGDIHIDDRPGIQAQIDEMRLQIQVAGLVSALLLMCVAMLLTVLVLRRTRQT